MRDGFLHDVRFYFVDEGRMRLIIGKKPPPEKRDNNGKVKKKPIIFILAIIAASHSIPIIFLRLLPMEL